MVSGVNCQLDPYSFSTENPIIFIAYKNSDQATSPVFCCSLEEGTWNIVAKTLKARLLTLSFFASVFSFSSTLVAESLRDSC